MSSTNSITVYGLASSRDGKIRYVGQTTYSLRIRHRRHLAEAFRIKRRRLPIWIRKELNAGYEIQCFVIDQDAVLHEAEKRLIAFYRRHGARLVNQTDGGEGTIGLDRKGQKKPPGFGAKISAARKGKVAVRHATESREKISRAFKGRSLSPEHRAKISNALKGKPKSKGHRAALSKRAKGRRPCLTPKAEQRRKKAAAIASGKPEVRAKRSLSMKRRVAEKKAAR